MGVSVSHEGVHKAKVEEFLLAKCPVTNAEYKRFIDATGHAPPEANSFASKHRLWNSRDFPSEIAGQPVVNVSWQDATDYCAWLAKTTGRKLRLPSEEEWEHAARGGLKGKKYPWGDALDPSLAWYGRKWNGSKTLADACYGKPNAYGLCGMAGNVWEWVADWYVPVFNDRPVQEELLLFRVLRGGAWSSEPDFLAVNYRSFNPPAAKDLFVGFRVACDAK